MTGADCWGIVWLFLTRELGLSVPRYDGDRDLGSALVERESAGLVWEKVNDPARRQLGDVIVFDIGRDRVHVGVAVEDGRFLHSMRGAAVIERVSALMWWPRITGVYRFVE